MFHPDTPFAIAQLQGDTPSALKKRSEEETVNKGLEKDYDDSPFFYTCPDSHVEIARYGWWLRDASDEGDVEEEASEECF